MKKYRLITLFFALLGFASCEGNKDMLMYDEQNGNYVYFAAPFKVGSDDKVLAEREDSMVFSFGFAELGTTEYTYEIPINLSGLASSVDREYIIEVISEETTAELNTEYETIKTNHVFRAGLITDTLNVKIFTSDALKNGYKRIKLKMLPSKDFQIGATEYSTLILSFTNRLKEPGWWGAWTKYMGPFCQEKYQKWINIYPIPEVGRVRDISYVNDKVVYWDNMPDFIMSAWYPVTFARLAEMRNYFDENIVYIDGDPANGRVVIPRL